MESCKPIGHLLLLLTCNTVVRITLMNRNSWFLLYQRMSIMMGFMYYFEGVTGTTALTIVRQVTRNANRINFLGRVMYMLGLVHCFVLLVLNMKLFFEL